METKKTQAASLENKRATHFLLGLTCALALLLAALEHTSSNETLTADVFRMDEAAQEFEAIPAITPKEMMSQSVDEQKIVPAEKIVVVEGMDLEDEEITSEEKESVAVVGERELSRDEILSTPVVPQPIVMGDQPVPFRILERLPEFPGGMSAFVQWLTQHLKYPPSARQQRSEGKVVASFIVNVDGTVANLQIVKSVNPMLDREALRVLRMMPKWLPGEYKGSPCRTVVNIPVVFKL